MFKKIATTSPQKVHQMMEQKDHLTLLDVRTPEEYRQVRIEGAKLLPVDEIERRASQELPDKQAIILVYCQSGMRARNAVKKLMRMGYTNVSSFGGIMNWPYKTIGG